MSTPVPPFPLSRAVVAAAGGAFDAPATTGSTNADLLARAPERPHASVVVTLEEAWWRL